LSTVSADDAARALCLWVNTPANPTGALDDLGAVAAWGRAHGVPVFSDECYIELTWDGPPRTILEHGLDGLVAVHSLSKRSNLAGLRAGFYLWAEAPDRNAWAVTEMLAREGGVLVSPGDFYGRAGAGYLRVAMVQPMARLQLVADRLSSRP